MSIKKVFFTSIFILLFSLVYGQQDVFFATHSHLKKEELNKILAQTDLLTLGAQYYGEQYLLPFTKKGLEILQARVKEKILRDLTKCPKMYSLLFWDRMLLTPAFSFNAWVPVLPILKNKWNIKKYDIHHNNP